MTTNERRGKNSGIRRDWHGVCDRCRETARNHDHFAGRLETILPFALGPFGDLSSTSGNILGMFWVSGSDDLDDVFGLGGRLIVPRGVGDGGPSL
jgi:hypothetical protein